MKDIETVIKRSRRYVFVDGLFESFMGGSFISMGLMYLGDKGISALTSSLSVSTRTQPLLYLPMFLLKPCLTSILWLSIIRLLTVLMMSFLRLKQRFTYPHIGYAATRPLTLKQFLKKYLMWILKIYLLIAMCFFAPMFLHPFAPQFAQFIVTSFTSFSSLPNKEYVIGASFFSPIFLYFAVRFGIARFYVLTAVSVLPAIIFSQTKIENGVEVYLILIGVALMISGGLTLRNFLRQNPLPQEDLQ